MKFSVVYDSNFGNTEQIARAIAGGITPSDEIEVLRVSDVNPSGLESTNFLIVGSPTHGGRPTPAIKAFLGKIPSNALKNISVAAFDTRISAEGKGVGLRIVVRVLGYAAGRIGKSLQKKGGDLVAAPEGFIVEGKEGPLKQGELERSAGWAKRIVVSRK